MRKSTLLIANKDLIHLSTLLSKGYSIQNALEIIGGYDQIIQELLKGNKIENYINFNSKNSFSKSLSFFIEISTLDQAIKSANDYEKLKRNLILKWIKSITYPLFVLFFSIVVFIFFENFLYPQLITFYLSDEGFQIHQFILIFTQCIYVLFILLILLFIIFILIKRYYYSVYLAIYKKYFSKIKIIKKIYTYDYAIHSLVLMKRGLSTKQVFESLFKMNKSLLNIPLNEMLHQLESGCQMIEIIEKSEYFDCKFKQFYKIGYYTQTVEKTIQDYCFYQEEEFQKYLKYSTYLICAFSYTFIALLVVSIYQMLLLPLNMIEQF